MIMENMDKAAMPVCDKINSILESDLAVLAFNGAISTFTVMDCPQGFYVIVTLKAPAPPLGFYVIARRNRGIPKLFKNLVVLNNHLKKHFPTDSITILRDCTLPPPRPPVVKSKLKKLKPGDSAPVKKPVKKAKAKKPSKAKKSIKTVKSAKTTKPVK